MRRSNMHNIGVTCVNLISRLEGALAADKVEQEHTDAHPTSGIQQPHGLPWRQQT